jgi:hypothetical protein
MAAALSSVSQQQHLPQHSTSTRGMTGNWACFAHKSGFCDNITWRSIF